ncbi:MAG: hypothetical protein HOM11_08655, partial [Methylococcales bacterium]|nr:hypothetical protein [Methylococcales bacterium]
KNRSPATSEMRLLSATLHGANPGFAKIRAKIHGAPDKNDAKTVREFAVKYIKKAHRADYLKLVDIIDQVFSFKNTLGVLKAAAKLKDAKLKKILLDAATELKGDGVAEQKLAVVGKVMVVVRNAINAKHSAREKLRLLRASLALEQEFFRISTELTELLEAASRKQQLTWLSHVSKAMYGTGFLYQRHLSGVENSLKGLFEPASLSIQSYRRALFYLARVIGWSDRTMAFNFQASQNHFAGIEPLVHLYPQDRLRSSPLLFFGKVTDNLVMDANRLAHKEHRFFGHPVGVGIRALNPGIAKGVLRLPEADNKTPDVNGIYLLPETTSDLTPVSGILTQGEGNALSHIQLLARNLAIPNVVIGKQWLDELKAHVGKTVVMAVSSDGVMVLEQDSTKWDQYFSKKTQAEPTDALIKPDLEKLDLEKRIFISLANLRASDSGKVSGPKGANLGELTFRFGDTVPSGFVIPFGMFKDFLEQPLEAGGPTVFSWMKASYAQIAEMPVDSAERAKKVSEFLGRLRHWIETTDPGVAFREKLKTALQAHFGDDGQFGVFVRSDTNVEDLPGFTGAGLNHTVGNVIGYDNILKVIR